MPSLFVIRGQDQGCRFELGDGTVSLGREAGVTIQLRDTEVSRRHAELRKQGPHYALFDLGSSNGTFVNGKSVRQHVLASGDQVQIGRSLLLYTDPGDETENLDEQIDIVGSAGGTARIVQSMSHEEGSQIFQLDVDSAKSPWLARARSNLQVMYRTALAVSHTLDIDQLLRRILDLIFEWVEADRGCIMLVSAETGELEPAARRDRKGIPSDEKMHLSQTILDYVMQRREGVLTSDAKQDARFDAAASILQQHVHEAICVPMQGRYDVVGVIYIDTAISPERIVRQAKASKFNEEHLKLMIAIAHQAALAVEDTRYYSAMVQAERLAAMGQTVATLSHHIKNILQGIRGGSYLIQMGLNQHDESIVRKGWGIVERRQEQISNLVLDMLTFSKDRRPQLVAANLNEVVSDVVDLIQSRAQEVHVQLNWTADAGVSASMFDPDGVHRAVLNVVTNAVDACQAAADDEADVPLAGGGQRAARVDVTTECLPAERLLRVVVCDNGPGIPLEEQQHIFSPFVSTKGNRGTGLGLPVSQKIAQEHGGRITVSSEPGQGSRFCLELPLVPPPVNDEEEAGFGDTGLGRRG